VAQTFFVDGDVKKLYRLDGMITVVQLISADRIILNKRDLLLTGKLKTEIRNGEDCVVVEATENENKILRISSGLVKEAGAGDFPLFALEDRIRSINPQAPLIRINFSRIEPKRLLNISGVSFQNVLDKEPDFLQSDGIDHVHDDTVSSVSWNFLCLELKVNVLQA